MIRPILITILLIIVISRGQKTFRRLERVVNDRKRILPPRDINGKFCKFMSVSRMRREVGVEPSLE